MAQLGGRTLRSLVTSLELLSDDEKLVLMLDRQEDGSVRVRTRKPWESTWASEGDSFTLKAADARSVSALFGSQDVSWSRSTWDEITTNDFSKPNPDEANEAEVARQVEERCSQLDIERAKAANIAEEMELLRLTLVRDHSLDKHITAAVEGCGPCDSAILASTFPGESFESDADEDEDPFA